MFGERHDLPHEFPEHAELIKALCDVNPVFDAMYKEYDALDEEILKIEQNIEPVSDVYAEDLKKKRMLLKDKLYETLNKQSASG
ncbi:MAG: DUF465 domain-containing protein [Gammaproteobacteria bacterium]|nr:DUF465 domain-containing protein [Gammaproteobacteria bacterium]